MFCEMIFEEKNNGKVRDTQFQVRKTDSWKIKFIYIYSPYRKPEKTTDLSQITDKLNHIMLYRIHIAMSGILTRNISGDSY